MLKFVIIILCALFICSCDSDISIADCDSYLKATLIEAGKLERDSQLNSGNLDASIHYHGNPRLAQP